jgi:hypothetical protein
MASARPAHSDQITADRSPTLQNTDTVQQRDDSRKDDPDPGLSPSTSSADLPYNKRDAGFVYRQTWKGKIWDTLDLPPFERRMLLKVDSVLLTLMAVGSVYDVVFCAGLSVKMACRVIQITDVDRRDTFSRIWTSTMSALL